MRHCLLPILLALFAPQAALATPYSGNAPVAYMIDVSSGQTLFDRDGDKRIPTASMAKMMTAYVVFDAIKSGEIKQSQKFKVRPETWTKWNNVGSTMFLKSNEEVAVNDLILGLMTLSGNDAAVVLAEGASGSEEAFAAAMNRTAKKLGMKDSHFGNASGWPDEGRTYSTAHDLSTLAYRLITDHPGFYREYFGRTEFRWNGVTQPNRNPLLGAIEGADGLKTGHTDEAGYCLAGTAKRGERRVLMVIAGLPSMAARLEEARAFMNWAFSAWKAVPLFKKGQVVAEVPVQLGAETSVKLVAPRYLAAALPANDNGKTNISVRYKGPIKAPFKKGAQIAELVVRLPDGRVQAMPLVAAQDVAEANFFERAVNGAKSLVGL
jgi:serine-type D-Ala-D-Ala carboxypeptidase (penicillin-binding protein 5/6)